MEEGVAKLAAPDLTVAVQTFLLATFRRNPDTSIAVYSVLIDAWMRRAGHAEPPRSTCPVPDNLAPSPEFDLFRACPSDS